jgi:zinc transport system substrate-binding protein
MIKQLILLIVFANISLFAKTNIVVSILPQKFFVEQITKDKADITVMVKPGNSPHTYEPKPSQMKDIAKANIYFSIGVEFEKSWLDKFVNQNQSMQIINVSKNIARYNKKDPHIWTSPKNVKIIALNILNTMIKQDPKNSKFYTKNYDSFIKYITNIDDQIKYILRNTKQKSKFMVFHPSWGYFALKYHLVQLPIQVQGKAPKPKDIVQLIKIAKKQKVKAIFTQPEFSTKVATTIANQLNIKVIQTSPLDPKWGDNLLKLAKAIAN